MILLWYTFILPLPSLLSNKGEVTIFRFYESKSETFDECTLYIYSNIYIGDHII